MCSLVLLSLCFCCVSVFSFPEIAFFRDELMQDALIDVLFSYCREHDMISYKQVSDSFVHILSPVTHTVLLSCLFLVCLLPSLLLLLSVA